MHWVYMFYKFPTCIAFMFNDFQYVKPNDVKTQCPIRKIHAFENVYAAELHMFKAFKCVRMNVMRMFNCLSATTLQLCVALILKCLQDVDIYIYICK